MVRIAIPIGTDALTIRIEPTTTLPPTRISWAKPRPNIRPVRSGGDSRKVRPFAAGVLATLIAVGSSTHPTGQNGGLAADPLAVPRWRVPVSRARQGLQHRVVHRRVQQGSRARSKRRRRRGLATRRRLERDLCRFVLVQCSCRLRCWSLNHHWWWHRCQIRDRFRSRQGRRRRATGRHHCCRHRRRPTFRGPPPRRHYLRQIRRRQLLRPRVRHRHPRRQVSPRGPCPRWPRQRPQLLLPLRPCRHQMPRLPTRLSG